MTVLAYQLRLVLQDIYQGNDAQKARQDFKSWCQWVKEKAQKEGHQLLEQMVRVARMIERHSRKGILGHWKAGLTTAFLEGPQQSLLCHQAQSPRLPHHQKSPHDALLRRR